MWSFIFVFYLQRMYYLKKRSKFLFILLIILAIDAFRTLFESIYFGLWYTAKVGLLPQAMYDFLVLPHNVFLPKFINVIAASIILFYLIRRWLPAEEEDRLHYEMLTEKMESAANKSKNGEADSGKTLVRTLTTADNLMEVIPTGLFVYEYRKPDSLLLVRANPAASQMTGIGEKENRGKDFRQLWPGEGVKDFWYAVISVARTGEPYVNNKYAYSDSRIAGAYKISVFKMAGPFVAIAFEDITLQDRVAEALRESEGRFRRLAENARDLIYRMRLSDGVYEYVSPSAFFQTGYTDKEFYETPFLINEVLHPDWRDYFVREWELLKKGNVSPTYEYQIIDKQGKTRWINQSNVLVCDDKGKPIAIEGIVSDVSERKKAEDELQRTRVQLEERVAERTKELKKINETLKNEIQERKQIEDRLRIFQRFANSTGQGFGIATFEPQITYVNQSLCKLIEEETIESALGKSFIDYYPREIHAKFKNEIMPRLLKDGQWRGELMLKGAKGKLTPTYENFFIIYDDNGKPMYIADVITDISQLKELEQSLVRKEKMATLGQLIATIGHELRNPLGTVRTSVFSMRKSTEKGDLARTQRALAIAEQNIIRCDHIIEEMLTYSRTMVLHKETVRFDEFVREIIGEQRIPEGVTIHTSLSSHATINIDREYFRRILINLLDNSLHAVEATNKEEKIISVSTHSANHSVRICFEDNGVGMSPEVQKKIFEPLYSTKNFGVGLGMTVVKDILEKHGGTMEVVSKEGEGTTITLKMTGV